MQYLLYLALIFTVSTSSTSLQAASIKDLTNVVGVRENQLIGYGIVVGLSGTGDGGSSTFTQQAMSNMLKSMDIQVNKNDVKSSNVAAVMITAVLPAFARQGDKVDIVVSSIGDAASLEGGTLLLTSLKGLDGQTYAIAQGPVSIGGMNSAAGAGQQNHATVGTVMNGASIEREISYDLYSKKYATLSLKESSFRQAVHMQDSINEFFDLKVAVAVDLRTIKLKKPKSLTMIEFLATVQNIEVEPDIMNKVVIDEKTGTIIAGVDIRIKPVVITQGGISITIDKKFLQAANTDVITISDLTNALQKLGAGPRNIIAILEAIKKAGALEAEFEII